MMTSNVATARGKGLAESLGDRGLVRLPRFDRAALRQAATTEAARLSAGWMAGDWHVLLRESGPDQVDVLIETSRVIAASQVLPVHVSGPADERTWYMVFTREGGGRSAGALQLAAVPVWIDVAVGSDRPATTLAAGDPAVRAAVADSVRATPDPGMSGWAAVVASLAPGDPLRQVIEEAAR